MKERFLKVVSKSKYANFFKALDYEYGINGKPLDLKKAFEMYKISAEENYDNLSMYKLYHIYKNEFKKFGLQRRNKILEKYYLFKSYSFESKEEMDCKMYYCLMNKFRINMEMKIYIVFEDKEMKKFEKLIEHLLNYADFYKIKIYDILVVEYLIKSR